MLSNFALHKVDCLYSSTLSVGTSNVVKPILLLLNVSFSILGGSIVPNINFVMILLSPNAFFPILVNKRQFFAFTISNFLHPAKGAEFISEYSISQDIFIKQDAPTLYDIQLEMPGTLSALLDEYGYNNAQKIKISGLMNIDDFSTIFSMKNLFYLDISDVVIKTLPVRDVEWRNKSFFERIEQIVLPKTLTKIDVDCFYECSKLQSINVPENVTSIGGFENCENLKSVVFSNSSNLLEIGVRCFNNCKSLKLFMVPRNVRVIGESAFAYSSLENIIFEDNSALTQIGGNAFGHTKITSIVIPANVQTIDAKAFTECKNLNTVIFEKESKLEALYNDYETVSDNASIGGVFSYCTSLKNIELPSTLEHIGTSTFYGCSMLEKIEIPSKVDALRRLVLGQCSSLKEVSFAPNSQLTLICDDYRIGFSSKEKFLFSFLNRFKFDNIRNIYHNIIKYNVAK